MKKDNIVKLQDFKNKMKESFMSDEDFIFSNDFGVELAKQIFKTYLDAGEQKHKLLLDVVVFHAMIELENLHDDEDYAQEILGADLGDVTE